MIQFDLSDPFRDLVQEIIEGFQDEIDGLYYGRFGD